MKIKSLYIASFGGVKNLKLDFSSGFNVIYAENESGKTTIMSFIKMMFYGSERGGNSLAKNIRKKYTPWDNSQMAGSIDFTHDNKNYRLEKEFRSSNSTDKSVLFDLDLSESQTVSGDIGSKIFGLSQASFERSVFIGQFGFPESDTTAEGEIASKLSNLALSGEENVSFEEVNKRLQKAKLSLMSKSGKAGEYDKNSKLLEEINEEIRKAENAKSKYNIKKSDAENLQAEIILISKTAEQLKQKIAVEQDCRNYEKYKKLLSLKEELETASKKLTLSDGTVIDDNYLNKIKFCVSKVEKAKNDTLSKENEIVTLKKSIEAGLNPPENATEENMQKLQAKIELLKLEREDSSQELARREQKLFSLKEKLPEAKNRKKPFNKMFLSFAGVLLILAIVLIFVSMLAFAVSGALAVVFAVLSFVVRPNDLEYLDKINSDIAFESEKVAEIEKVISEKNFEIGSDTAEYEAIKAALNATSKVIENQEQMLAEANDSLEQLKRLEKDAFSELAEIFFKYKTVDSLEEIKELIPEISQKAQAVREIKTELNFYLNELGGISYDTAREKLEEMKDINLDSNIDFNYLKSEYEKLLQEISDKKSKIATLVTEAKMQVALSEKLDEYKQKQAFLLEKMGAQKQYCEILDIASEVLSESFSEVHSSYGLVLENKASEIFSRLTKEKYSSMTISKSFDITVRERDVFGSRDIGFLSSGTADQGYLSLRLAIAKLISEEKEALPILLDDSLAQYDDERMKMAIEFLSDYAKEQQIVMFTCHNAIADMASENNAQITAISK